ncbi:hypothetical protein L1987_03090 [Smallanthus sonchifolius]|uniref:Uncharacterized protein n=1 Tax=Smallanthus sonchifolius TaxID=185202 RepID=A0ACB9K9K6_9ASTR|nr:hypothetical protein L1987_03090 [Smallanthus sonchifolius]
MAELPSEIMYDILSRMPVKSLARFRCVSKLWCNYINDSYLETMHAKRAPADNPMLIMFHQIPSNLPNSPCRLSLLEYKDTCTLEVRKKPPVMEFMCKSFSYRFPDDIILGSCNGLLYSSKGHHDGNMLVVIHPLRRECYELPPINRSITHPQQTWGIGCDEESYRLRVEESFGLGFDESTNTFKMVSVVLSEEYLCTMVHVLGTDSWRKIPQVSSYPITGEGVFANGCLHWLINDEYPIYLGRPVIRFDMANEEFGLIHPPQKRPSGWIKELLVDLHGEVGYVYHIVNRRIEVWVLKERGWVMHCEFRQKPPLPKGFVKILGFWNENGDVLMTDNRKRMFIYNLKSDNLYEDSFIGWDENSATDIRMYRSSYFFQPPLKRQKLV